MKYLAIVFLLLSFQTSNRVIRGKLIANHPNYGIGYGQVLIYNQQHCLIGQSRTDEQGNFSCSIKKKYKDVYISYKVIGIPELFLSRCPAGDSIFIISLPVPINRDSLGKAICPMCLRSDVTKRILPGEGIQIVRSNISKAPNSADSVFYSGICTWNEQDPKYYCERDEIRF